MSEDTARPAAHEISGLQMLTGNGEWLWRPVHNPETLQISLVAEVEVHHREGDAGPARRGLVEVPPGGAPRVAPRRDVPNPETRRIAARKET